MAAEPGIVRAPIAPQRIRLHGRVARVGVAGALLAAAVLIPLRLSDVWQLDAALAVVFAVVGLSMNVLVGYTGQISLGQQGFLGLGALVAANVTHSGVHPADPFTFSVGLVASVAISAAVAMLLGVVALRITGLYLALVTLIFGAVMADVVYTSGALNGQGAGVPAYRPTFLAGNGAFYLFCLVVLALVVYIDWRLTTSKAGRALIAVRENELVAQAFGVSVMGYKLLAFALSGAMAGLAGGLFAFRVQGFADKDFTGVTGFNLALIFVVMVVVGGLGSRVGVIVASAFFGLLSPLLELLFTSLGWDGFYTDHKGYLPGLIGSVLLLLTVIQHPGGLGDQLRPLTRWLSGRRFSLHDPDDAAGPGGAEGSSVRA